MYIVHLTQLPIYNMSNLFCPKAILHSIYQIITETSSPKFTVHCNLLQARTVSPFFPLLKPEKQSNLFITNLCDIEDRFFLSLLSFNLPSFIKLSK